MIDWFGVVTNGLWVLGLAGTLATLSYFDYYARSQGKPVRQVLKAPMFVRPFSWAIAAFCLGVAASSGSWWQRVAWAALAVLFGVQAWQSRAQADSGKIQ
jgi:hypothetical protein